MTHFLDRDYRYFLKVFLARIASTGLLVDNIVQALPKSGRCGYDLGLFCGSYSVCTWAVEPGAFVRGFKIEPIGNYGI